MAVLAGAGLQPAVATEDRDEPLHLDAAHVQQVRERVDRLVQQQPPAMTALGGSTTQATTVHPQVERHAGADRYATAAALAENWWADYFWHPDNGPLESEKVVFIASGETFADALSAGAAAAAWGGPVLLTRKGGLPASTSATLERLQPDAIVVMGGTAAISSGVETALHEYVRTPDNVVRMSGTDRYAVSASTTKLIGEAPVAYVASGENYPDGLAGGAAAGSDIAPLVLSKRGDVPNAVMDALRTTVRPTHIYVLGGTVSLTDDVVSELRTVAPVTRIGGKDRYEVAERIADLHPTTYGATVASGANWPDALAGSAFAGLVGDKLLLLRPDGVPPATQRAVHKHSLVGIDALGGVIPLPEAVLDKLRALDVAAPELPVG